jgi:hypothetical protein
VPRQHAVTKLGEALIFDVLANPFAVLELTADASDQAVALRARELGRPTAAAAKTRLLRARTRLEAEVSFLLGVPAANLRECLEALRAGAPPDLASLTPLARANVLAHFASRGQASPQQLRQLPELHDGLTACAVGLLRAAREAARKGPVSDADLGPAMVALRSKHAQAVVSALRDMEDGADLLADMLPPATGRLAPGLPFLREVSLAWDRATASDLSRLSECADDLEKGFRLRPDLKTAAELGHVVRDWARLIRPARAAAKAFLQPDIWGDKFKAWDELVRYLEKQGAEVEAIELLGALVEAQAADRKACQALQTKYARLFLLRDRDGATAEMRRLLAVIQAVRAAPPVLLGPCV